MREEGMRERKEGEGGRRGERKGGRKGERKGGREREREDREERKGGIKRDLIGVVYFVSYFLPGSH